MAPRPGALLLALLPLLPPGCAELAQGPWSDRSLPPGERARRLVANLTLAEKLSMLHGPESCERHQRGDPGACAYIGNVPGIPRLKVPPISMNDGPQGFRVPKGEPDGTSTAWPSGLSIAATWDVDALHEWGAGMGKEFFEKGANVLLGPGLNVARVPRNGRNFEYLSGEDPFLGRALVKPAVRGIQSQKVVANAKHWVLNNQETYRDFVSAEADARTRFEMYYPPFEGAIEAGVGSFMCGYNKIHGRWSCESHETLVRDLKGALGFQGYVMSDWGATHSTSLAAGLDMEMPGAKWMTPEHIEPAIKSGALKEADVDDAVTRVFRPMFAVGVMDEPASAWSYENLRKNVTTAASAASARRLAAASTVLLKNDAGLLPLAKGQKVAVIGFGDRNVVMAGGGSGRVTPSYLVTPLEGIRSAVGDGGEVTYCDGTNLFLAAALAASSDVAVVFVGTRSREGRDRASLSLDEGCFRDSQGQCVGNRKHQNAMVELIVRANPRTVVVVSAPGAVLMPWSRGVPAILMTFLAGQQVGNGIADVLFGRVSPSAKLPLTMPNAENETALAPSQWPGVPDPERPEKSFYTEKLLVGYRYYDQKGINFTTGFPFGHGLSYAAFAYSDLAVQGLEVSFSVANSGAAAGAEVAQLYLGFPPEAGEPPLQLKGFRRTAVLPPGGCERVTLQLTPRELSTWSEAGRRWAPVPGAFRVAVGSSSRDLRLSGSLRYPAPAPEPLSQREQYV